MIGLTYHYLRNACNLHKDIHPLDCYTLRNKWTFLKDFKTIMFDDDLDSLFEKNFF